jgi:hypothetical protein
MTLLASRNATREDFVWVIKALETGQINLTPWITHRVAPEEIVTEFSGWLDPQNGVVKAMLEL